MKKKRATKRNQPAKRSARARTAAAKATRSPRTRKTSAPNPVTPAPIRPAPITPVTAAAPAGERSRAADAEERIEVFVYGTLMRGQTNHRYLEHARFLGPARTLPTFRLYNMGFYPAMAAEGRDAIEGEVYEVDPATLVELDRLESHPRVYQRTLIALGDGRYVSAYLMPAARVAAYEPIDSGSWRTHLSART
jgi:gamma-glutamylaminecyclotransferase